MNLHTRRDPTPRLERTGEICPERLERALELDARRTGSGRYLVTGGAEPHWVDLYSSALPACDCGDYLWRDTICKHILIARLREGDSTVIRAVAGLVSDLKGRAARRPAIAA